jgi:hypothetical protein
MSLSKQQQPSSLPAHQTEQISSTNAVFGSTAVLRVQKRASLWKLLFAE